MHDVCMVDTMYRLLIPWCVSFQDDVSGALGPGASAAHPSARHNYNFPNPTEPLDLKVKLDAHGKETLSIFSQIRLEC